MNSAQFEKWGRTRERGRRRFVLLSGVCCFGLTWGLTMGLLFGFHRFPGAPASAHEGFDWLRFLVFIPSGVLAGALWGIIMWHLQEWQYTRALARQTTPIEPAKPTDAEQ